jgi:tetratricopeptide (TPR) repeat protein
VAKALTRAERNSEADPVFNEALAAFHAIEDANSRSQTLVDLSETLAEAGRFTQALEVSHSISPDGRSQALSDVAFALAEAGRVTEALDVVHEIEDTTKRASALSEMAGALAKAGRTSEAFDAARGTESAGYRSLAMSRVGGALTEVGRADEAAHAFGEALDVALGDEDPNGSMHSLASLARILAKSGHSAEALDVASRIDIPYYHYRIWALTGVAAALVLAGHANESGHVFGEAREIANGIRNDPYGQGKLLSDIVGELVNGNRTAEALGVARTIELDRYRASALSKVAASMAGAGPPSA